MTTSTLMHAFGSWLRSICSRGIWANIHYLDEFLVLGTSGSAECREALNLAISTCTELGVPLTMDKVEGPLISSPF